METIFDKPLDKQVSINMQDIANLKGSDDLGSNTVANIQDAIYALVGNMSNGEQRNITFAISTASDPFSAAVYIGQVMRISRTRFRVEASEAVYKDSKILGRYKDGTWSWQQLVTNENLETSIFNIGGRLYNLGQISSSRSVTLTASAQLIVLIVGMSASSSRHILSMVSLTASNNARVTTISNEAIVATANGLAVDLTTTNQYGASCTALVMGGDGNKLTVTASNS